MTTPFLGRIYLLSHPDTDAVYVGSTCRRLSARKAEHTRDWKLLSAGIPAKRYKQTTATYVTQHPGFSISLLEERMVASKAELHAMETEQIRRHPTAVNRADPITARWFRVISAETDAEGALVVALR
jgi:hypothetical protein